MLLTLCAKRRFHFAGEKLRRIVVTLYTRAQVRGATSSFKHPTANNT